MHPVHQERVTKEKRDMNKVAEVSLAGDSNRIKCTMSDLFGGSITKQNFKTKAHNI